MSELHLLVYKQSSVSLLSFPSLFLTSPSLKVSLHLRLHHECGTVKTELKVWNDKVIKAIAHLPMDEAIMAEVKKGLEIGQKVDLPPHLAFSPQLLANLFASEEQVRPFQQLR